MGDPLHPPGMGEQWEPGIGVPPTGPPPLCTVAPRTWDVLGFELFFWGGQVVSAGFGVSSPPPSMGGRRGGEIFPDPGPGALQPLRAHGGRGLGPFSSVWGCITLGATAETVSPSLLGGGTPLGARLLSAIPSTPIPVHKHPSLRRTLQCFVGPRGGDTTTLSSPAPQKHLAPPSTAVPHTHTARTFSNRVMGFWGAFGFFLPASGPGVCIWVPQPKD